MEPECGDGLLIGEVFKEDVMCSDDPSLSPLAILGSPFVHRNIKYLSSHRDCVRVKNWPVMASGFRVKHL